MKRFCLSIVSLLLLLLAGACSGKRENPPMPPGQEPTAAPAVDEDALIMRLSVELVADPKTPAERDRNAIVNYAIDHLLDVQMTPSGLFYLIRSPGEGPALKWGNPVKAHYKGFFLDGRVFDSSYGRHKPLSFAVGEMIDGWNEALQLLRPGARALLLVPSDLAYGENGLQNSTGQYLVPPGEPLAFELEIMPADR